MSRAGALALALLSAACSRHIVMDPDLVFTANDKDWRIAREPTADAGAAAPRPSSAPAEDDRQTP